jgi:hypothetical protein
MAQKPLLVRRAPTGDEDKAVAGRVEDERVDARPERFG